MTDPYVEEVRTGYDAVAETYAGLVDSGVITDNPMDRGMLDAFVGYLRADGEGPVADLGCGPGRLCAHLAARGVEVAGFDLSPGMLAQARARHPGLLFESADLAALPLHDGGLAGALLWYSLIHTPPERRPEVLAEVHRVLRPGGRLLLAFQVGDDQRVRHQDAYGHEGVAFDGYRISTDAVVEQLEATGFEVTARSGREPEGWEPTPQAYLLARRSPQD